MKREHYLDRIKQEFEVHTVCAILGPRQVGKTTLARMYLETYFPHDNSRFFDLEDPIDLDLLRDPMYILSNLTETFIVIDEIQRRPDLFPILRVLVDKVGNKKKFLILGSASRDLIQQSSETLAGRIGYIELNPFSLFEVNDIDRLWVRGGFPRSYLADSEENSFKWRQSYITTFLERDVPNLGFTIPANQLRQFWLMLAHYHGQVFVATEIGKSLSISNHTARRYLEILQGTFMVRILTPWYENISKRQVKSPKIYFRDSGILNTLLNIQNKEELFRYPKLGAFWEGFALEEIIRYFNAVPEECFFWATQSHAELDLLLFRHGKRIGFEFKFGDGLKITKSMNIAIEDLKLDKLVMVYPGKEAFNLSDKIIACGLDRITIKDFI